MGFLLLAVKNYYPQMSQMTQMKAFEDYELTTEARRRGA
jgi:hypothetical protein